MATSSAQSSNINRKRQFACVRCPQACIRELTVDDFFAINLNKEPKFIVINVIEANSNYARNFDKLNSSSRLSFGQRFRGKSRECSKT